MSIELEPSELTFQRPFTREVSQTLYIMNPNRDPVAFKVKTTAPKQYCVRPNSGRIEAGKDVEVQVLLQAMKSDPPADFKCRDKFLVQSVAITPDREASNVQQIWSHVEKTAKSDIKERKIRVVYLQPGENGNGNTAGDVSFENSSPPPYTSPQAEAPLARENKYAGDTTTPATAPAVPPASTSKADDDTASALAAAKETIARLEAELKNQGLRLRKTAGAASDAKDRITEGAAGMGMTAHPPEGIPVQICAALCLLAFFLGWFFF